MGVNKLKEGLNKNEVDKLHPKMKRFIKELEKRFGEDGFVITSGADYTGSRKNEKSNHKVENGANAIDIRINQKVMDYLTRTKEGIELLQDYGYGFIDERQALNDDFTGAHFHIGPDQRAKDELKSYVNQINDGSLELLNPDTILKQSSGTYRKDAYDEYQSELNKINDPNSELTESEKEEARQKLIKKFQDDGRAGFVNDEIRQETQRKRNEWQGQIDAFESGQSKGGAKYWAMVAGDYTMTENGKLEFTLNEEEFNKVKPYLSKEEIALFDKKEKTQPGPWYKGKKPTVSYEFGGKKSNLANPAKVWTADIDKEYKAITGEDLFAHLITDPAGGTAGPDNEPATLLTFRDRKPNFTQTAEEVYPEPELLPKKTVPNIIDEPAESNEGGEASSSKTSTSSKTDTSKADATVKEVFGDFFERDTIDKPDTLQYDADSFNPSIPFGALAQAGLALKGLNDADVDIPLRDEKISQSIISYAQQLKKLATMGLRPEEEAYMKSMVSDAYSEGMERLTRASGGNRNIVLGNASSLNRNRLQGMMNIAMADIQKKDAWIDKYGDVLNYIENFNRERDVANHNIRYSEALRKREGGEQLASSAFANMIDEIQYAKENAPGSPQHALKSALMFENFGFVPGMKDNGLGDTPGTKSYAKRLAMEASDYNAAVTAENEAIQNIRSEYNNLPAELRVKMENDGMTKQWFGDKFKAAGIRSDLPTRQKAGIASSIEPETISNELTGNTVPGIVSSANRTFVSSEDSNVYDGDTVQVNGQGQRLHMFDAEEQGFGNSEVIANELNSMGVSYPNESVSTSFGRPVRRDVRLHNELSDKGLAMDSLYMAKGGRGKWLLEYAENAKDSTRGNRLNTQFVDQLLTEEELKRQKQNRYGN